MNIFHVICAGEKDACFKIEPGDFCVAADAGVKYAKEYAITPDLIIGDFDSLGYVPQEENVVRLPCEKDDTDTLAALKYGIKKGYELFVLHCASGGECDHFFANASALAYLAKRKKTGIMFSGSKTMLCINNKKIVFDKSFSGKLSVFAVDNAVKTSISGLKYCFNGVLTNDFPIGVSNQFIGKSAEISAQGCIMLVFEKSDLSFLQLTQITDLQ